MSKQTELSKSVSVIREEDKAMEGHSDSQEEDVDRQERLGQKEALPIRKLEQDVVNKIAAGEIIHRPANALKELIENSLDAGATLIKITLRDGGLKMLQIQDNGSGVKSSDMPLLCERFATSKLRDFSDLSRMTTFGFRGEALASISYVSASMTVVSKTKDSDCAYRASYGEGRLRSAKPGQSPVPKPCAGTDGTLITAEDLFYNVPQRRRALKSTSEEYNRALDIVSKYSVHFGGRGVGFVCKKASSNVTDLSTPASTSATTLNTIRLLHGSSVARELIRLKPRRYSDLNFSVEGWLSGPNYASKRTTFLLFINHRLVDCPPLKRSFEALYTSLLPKGGHPWIYLSLELDPGKVDVNVHPTKREVRFLDEDDVVEAVCTHAEECLAGANTSRTFQFTQATLPGAGIPREKETPSETNSQLPPSARGGYPQHMVRVDANSRTLDSLGFTQPANEQEEHSNEAEAEVGAEEFPRSSAAALTPSQPTMPNSRKRITESNCSLHSIKSLRQEIVKGSHSGLTSVFQNHTFVGVADASRCLLLLQHKTKLFLVNYATILEDFAYQLALRQFGDLARIRLSPSPSLRSLMEAALMMEAHHPDSARDSVGGDEVIIEKVTKLLISKAEMLDEYFSLKIDVEEGLLETLPALLPGQATVVIERLPLFLLRLVTEVDWKREKECLEGIAKELALLHVPLGQDVMTVKHDDQDEKRKKEEEERGKVTKVLAQAWLPAMRCYFPSKQLLRVEEGEQKPSVSEVANLPSLYSVFERC